MNLDPLVQNMPSSHRLENRHEKTSQELYAIFLLDKIHGSIQEGQQLLPYDPCHPERPKLGYTIHYSMQGQRSGHHTKIP